MTTANGGYEVILVRHGTWLTTHERAFLEPLAGSPPEDPFTLDYYFWVIRGPRRTVLVDTGFSAAEAARRGRTATVDIPSTLATLGIGADWDGDLVLTHGHYDHTGHLRNLPRARIHLARAERDFWFDDPASLTTTIRALVDEADLAALRHAEIGGRVVIHDRDGELTDGIDLVLAPGHTPGQLMVRVRTAHGIVLITSDAAHFDEEYLADRPFHDMTDVDAARDVYASIRRMREAGIHVVAGHEAGLLDRYPPADPPLDRDAVVLGRIPFPS